MALSQEFLIVADAEHSNRQDWSGRRLGIRELVSVIQSDPLSGPKLTARRRVGRVGRVR